MLHMLQWFCIRMFQASIPNVSFVFQTYVASVFIWMLHMFHAYVASILSGCCVCVAMVFKCFSRVFASVSDAHSSVSSVFFCMLQVLDLDISKVYRVLHMKCAWEV